MCGRTGAFFSSGELSSYPLGFPRLGPFHTCLESTEPEWPPCYRATSTHDLLWDSDRLSHTPESPLDLLHRPLRGRAFSESHLNLEPASPWGRDQKDHFRAKLDPPSIPKKKGPPPPRPPPPNWEKYRQRRASQHPPDGAGHGSAFSAAPMPIRSIAEAVKERSQSLTGEQEGQSWGHTSRPPAPLGAWPRPEPPRSLRRTPGPHAANAEICRQVLPWHGGGSEAAGTAGTRGGFCGPLYLCQGILIHPLEHPVGFFLHCGVSLTSFPGMAIAPSVCVPMGGPGS